jgi:pyrimidine-nucleoside phosphorylase
LLLGRVAKTRAEATARLEHALTSGYALERLEVCVRLHGGDVRVIDDPTRLPRARRVHVLRAPRAGVVTVVDAGLLGRAATVLGAGRLRKEDPVDAGVGLTLHAKQGARVARGEPLCTVRYSDEARLRAARADLEAAFRLAARAPKSGPLVLETIS